LGLNLQKGGVERGEVTTDLETLAPSGGTFRAELFFRPVDEETPMGQETLEVRVALQEERGLFLEKFVFKWGSDRGQRPECS